MKKALPILLLSILPGFAMAAGDHGHDDAHEHGDHHGHEVSNVGKPGIAADVSHTIEIMMDDDMRFTPDHIEVDAGDTVRLLVRNTGKLVHEIVLGDTASLLEHAAMMLKMPDMEHEDPNMLTVEPGESGELIWKFDEAGIVDFACLIPGHFEAGMKGSMNNSH